MIVILNGPKGCGKDTIARILNEKHGFGVIAFKDQLYEETAAFICQMMGKPLVTPAKVRERNEDRELKERPWIGGLSVRQWLILVSEGYIKPNFGKDYFGRALLDTVQDLHSTTFGGLDIAVSDGGFDEEVRPLAEALPGQVLIVRLARRHFGYGNGDSRGWISDDIPGTSTRAIRLQEGRPDLAVEQILDEVRQCR